ncbi:hypothetical protein C8J57DRAFT_1463522 [Mycena rebaudengoi]|nr:hypothetical protein C8J57DRAFT_1463522 [Mycena rebaudengoi]
MPCRFRPYIRAIPSLLRRSKLTVRAPRYASTTSSPKLEPPRPSETLDLVQAAVAFLPQVQSILNASQIELWNGILSASVADLRSTELRPARLIVSGPDFTGARDLATAILIRDVHPEDVYLKNDIERYRAVRERWICAPPGKTSLTTGNSANNDLHLPLILDRLPVPLQVTELTPAADPVILYAADITVFVSGFEELHKVTITNPNSLVVVNMDIPAKSQPRASSSRLSLASQYLFVSPSQALNAWRYLKGDPDNGSMLEPHEQIQCYSEAHQASRLGMLLESIREILWSLGDDPSTLRNRTALATLRGAFDTWSAAIQDAKTTLDGLSAQINDVQSILDEERAKVHRAVFGAPEEDTVERAVKAARDTMKLMMDRYSWNRMAWNTTGMGNCITVAMKRAWCTDLDIELTSHARRLAGVQRTLTASAFALLASADKARLNSPILLQTLNELADSPTFFIAPEELTAPIHARSAQITKSSTIQLQSTARRMMFQTGAILLISVTINWTSMATELIGNGGFLQPMVALPTAVMIGTAGVRWGVWRWNRIKQVWWSSFGSAADGLKQDLSDTLDRIVEDKVVVVPKTACLELSKLVGSRRLELDRLQHDLDRLAGAVLRSV